MDIQSVVGDEYVHIPINDIKVSDLSILNCQLSRQLAPKFECGATTAETVTNNNKTRNFYICKFTFQLMTKDRSPLDDDLDDAAANLKPKFTDCGGCDSTTSTAADLSTRITFPLSNLAQIQALHEVSIKHENS
jgi:hypothetical protein